MQYTENYSLKLPGYGDNADVGDLNDNTTAIDALIHANRQIEAPAFSTDTAYTTGDMCVYENVLYKFTADKAAGNWDSTKVTATNLADEVTDAAQSGGTTVIANPAEPATADLHKLQVENTVYGIPDPTVTKEVQSATGTQYVEFTDGADAPLVKCTTTIQGNQDLHGYDKPWVGGAGKNKLPMTVSGIKALNTSGTWSGNSYTVNGVTFSIITDESENVTGINVVGTASGTSILILGIFGDFLVNGSTYTFNGNPTNAQSYTQIQKSNGGGNVNTPNEFGMAYDSSYTDYYRWVIRCDNASVNNDTYYPMIRLSTETDSTFAPYSNICPITAYDESTISVGNISKQSDYTLVDDYYINADGVITQNNVYKYCPEYIKVEPNKTYPVSMYKAVEIQVGFTVPMYDKNKQFISRVVAISASSASGVGTKTGTFTTTNETAFIRFSCPKESTDQTIGVKVPHTTTFTNSIYQGNADFVGGKARATWGYIASYNGETLPGEWISSMDEYAPGTTPTTGAQVAYELASPTEETVTPTNLPIKSLFGYNHIESSTGEMEVEYFPAKEQPLIDLIPEASNMHTYSTEEHAVGTWVDGSTIYERSIDLGSFSIGSEGTYIIEQATDIDLLIDYDGYVIENSIMYALPDPSIRIKMDSNKDLIFSGTASRYVSSGYLTIRYTKSTAVTRSLSKGSTDSLKADLSEVKDDGEESVDKVDKVDKVDEPTEKTETIEEKEENAGESNSENER